MARISLAAGDYALAADPAIGGSIRNLTWRGQPILREATGDAVLDAACFPLVPFSNRIAHGRFTWDVLEVGIAPNFPDRDHPHPLHGFGWISAWKVIGADQTMIEMEHPYPGGEWPWPYRARQCIRLAPQGVKLTLSLRNQGDSPMPAGIGFHPYFPRAAQTVLHALHCGECCNDADGLPHRIDLRQRPIDWWDGGPVGSRFVDGVYVSRSGPVTIIWPERQLAVRMDCDPAFAHTTIYVPPEEDWFCAEPVSHVTNAVNKSFDGWTMPALAPGAEMQASIRLVAQHWQAN